MRALAVLAATLGLFLTAEARGQQNSQVEIQLRVFKGDPKPLLVSNAGLLSMAGQQSVLQAGGGLPDEDRPPGFQVSVLPTRARDGRVRLVLDASVPVK